MKAKKQTTDPANDLSQNSVYVSVRLGAFGNRRGLDKGALEVDSDKSMINATKRLLDCPEMDAITKADSALRVWLYDRSLPSFFKEGVYLLSDVAVPVVDKQLRRFRDERAVLVSHLCSSYAYRIREAQDKLLSNFNPNDYPPLDNLRASFTCSWSYLSLGVPGKLESISADLYAEEKRKAEEQTNRQAEECRVYLREGMAELLDHMVSRLTPDDNGKPKIFHDSGVQKIKSFLDNFSLRNITGDDELGALVQRAKMVLGGVDAPQLRTSESLKAKVRSTLATVKEQVDGLVVAAKASRRYVFDE